MIIGALVVESVILLLNEKLLLFINLNNSLFEDHFIFLPTVSMLWLLPDFK